MQKKYKWKRKKNWGQEEETGKHLALIDGGGGDGGVDGSVGGGGNDWVICECAPLGALLFRLPCVPLLSPVVVT